MNTKGLSLDQAPPYFSVQSFFLTAPLFVLLAGLAVVFFGKAVFLSPLNFRLIGITHWMTLGFFTMVMFGALIQMLPVVAGVKVPNPVWLSRFVNSMLAAGAFLIGASYFLGHWKFLAFGIFFLLASFTGFLPPVMTRLFSVKNATATVKAMRLAVLSLGMVVVYGFIMALWRLGWINGTGQDLLSVHIFWAFAGWIGILIAGISFQVIPMFFVAPEYPKAVQKYFAPFLFTLLVLYSLASFFLSSGTEISGVVKLSIRIGAYLLGIIYAVVTYRLLRKRKRKLPDPSLLFWKTALFFLFLSAGLAFATEFVGELMAVKLRLLSGLLFGFGFVFGVITAMIYKIVPFLSWFHLASKGVYDAPNMKDLLPDVRVRLHYGFYVFFMIIINGLVFKPVLLYQAFGILLALLAVLLWLNIFMAVRKYIGIKKTLV